MPIIITLPNYDLETNYLSCYSQELIKFANDNGKKIIGLKKPLLCKAEFKKRVQTNNPCLIIINGHGDEHTIFCNNFNGKEEILIAEYEDNSYLLGKTTFARACSAGASLGKTLAEKQGCFIGFKIPFVFYADDTYVNNPIKDKRARIFLEPTNELAKSLVKDQSPEHAAEVFQTICSKNLYHILNKPNEPGFLMLATALWNNMEALVVINNKTS